MAEKHDDATLAKLAELLLEQHGVKLSYVSIHRALGKLELTLTGKKSRSRRKPGSRGGLRNEGLTE